MSLRITEGVQVRLKAVFLRFGLPEELFEKLMSYHTLVTYQKSSSLFKRGAPADVFFWILSGVVDVLSLEGGNRVLARVAGPGDLVGYVNFVDKNGRIAQCFEAIAQTRCEVALITREHVSKSLLELNPTHFLHLMECINSFWSAAVSSWTGFIGLNYRARLECALADLGERFGIVDARGTILRTELLQARLAEIIGSSRPMVTRLIKEMIHEGILERHGKQYILLRRTVAKNPEILASTPPHRPSLIDHLQPVPQRAS